MYGISGSRLRSGIAAILRVPSGKMRGDGYAAAEELLIVFQFAGFGVVEKRDA